MALVLPRPRMVVNKLEVVSLEQFRLLTVQARNLVHHLASQDEGRTLLPPPPNSASVKLIYALRSVHLRLISLPLPPNSVSVRLIYGLRLVRRRDKVEIRRSRD